MANNIMLSFYARRAAANVIINHVQRRNMPVNVPPTATGKRRFRLSVETDPHKLVNYCCGLNYHIDEPLIKLKEDHEYPEWLWNLRLSPKPNSWEMEKGTKEYYLRLAEEGTERKRVLSLRAAKVKKTVGKTLKEEEEYLHRLRFAALAHLEDDVGLEANALEPEWWGTNLGIKVRANDYYLPKNENKVIYMDKIEGNSKFKNYHYDPESTFKSKPKDVRPPLRIELKAFQDSKRRHRYAAT